MNHVFIEPLAIPGCTLGVLACYVASPASYIGQRFDDCGFTVIQKFLRWQPSWTAEGHFTEFHPALTNSSLDQVSQLAVSSLLEPPPSNPQFTANFRRPFTIARSLVARGKNLQSLIFLGNGARGGMHTITSVDRLYKFAGRYFLL